MTALALLKQVPAKEESPVARRLQKLKATNRLTAENVLRFERALEEYTAEEAHEITDFQSLLRRLRTAAPAPSPSPPTGF